MITIPSHEQLALASYIQTLTPGTKFTTADVKILVTGFFRVVRNSPPALSINASYGKCCKRMPRIRQVGRCNILDMLGHPTTAAIFEKL